MSVAAWPDACQWPGRAISAMPAPASALNRLFRVMEKGSRSLDPRFTLRQIRYFLAAARAGSVNQAAFDVNISAPSISAAINQLETQYNIQIFIRHHSHGLLMTEDGKKFFAAAKAFFEHAESLENQAQGLGKTISSVVHAGCFITLAPIIIPQISNAYAREFPDSRLSFIEGHQAKMLDSLREGIIQIAFTYDFGIGRDLDFEPLGEVAPYCILPTQHRLAERDSIALADLADDPMVFLDLPKSGEYYMSLFEQAKISPKIVYRSSLPEVVRVLVAHGLGYSILAMPTHHAVAMDGASYLIKPLSDTTRNLRVGMLASSETASTYTYEAIRAVAKEALAEKLLPN